MNFIPFIILVALLPLTAVFLRCSQVAEREHNAELELKCFEASKDKNCFERLREKP